ncbi:MAG: two-component regulator propeller domain-containing protein, partial [Lewinella sp.]
MALLSFTKYNTSNFCHSFPLLLLLLLLPAASFGQKVYRSSISEQDHAQNFTHLPDGFYWYGNSSGLYRFDGQQSTRYLVKDIESDINHDQFVASEVYQDANAHYWFTTYQALHRLDPLSGKFKTFRLNILDQKINTGYTIFHFDSIREEILLRADSSLFAFNTGDFTYRLLREKISANSLYSIVEDGTVLFFGAPWWNNDGIEYFKYTAGGITNFQQIDLPVMVKAIAPYAKDSLYLATPEGFQLVTNPLNPKIRKLETIISGEARTVALDPTSRDIYVSVAQEGVSRFSVKDNRVVAEWNTDSGLNGPDARALAPDGRGNVIVSHLTEGVDIITTNNPHISFVQLPDGSEISDIALFSNGDIFVLSNQGSVYRKGRNKQAALREDLKQLPGLNKAKIGISPMGEITAHGMWAMATFSSDGVINRVQKTDTSIYHGVIPFDDGEKLILSNEGIVSIKGDSVPAFLKGIPHGKNDFFSYLIKLSDHRFLASYRQVALWDFKRTGKGWEVSNKIPTPGDTQSAVLHDDGLYLGTTAGLLLLNQDSLSTVFNPISTTGNLWINALHQDNKNRLWLGTEQGLFCYYPKTGKHLYFSEADGIPDDWFIRANVIANDSTFTMATKTGLVTVDTRLADATTSDNKIYLSDIWVNGIRQTEHSLYDPQPLDLDFQHNAISFLPGMIELSSSSLSGFRYRLVGLEEAYTYSKAGEVVRYPSIPPGDYTFEFVGVDKNGRNTEPFTLPVSIS